MSPAPAGPYPPNSELVAVAWLKGVTGLNDDLIGPALPKDITKWRDEGFLQVTAIPGGRTPDPDIPRRQPVVQLDGWGVAGDPAAAGAESTLKPAFARAFRLIELVRLGTEAQDGRYLKIVELPDGYADARVQAAYLITDPSRVDDDPSGYGRVTADLAIDWVPA